MNLERYLSCVDTHSSGEATRILIGGIPKIKGGTMQEKQDFFRPGICLFRRRTAAGPPASEFLLSST